MRSLSNLMPWVASLSLSLCEVATVEADAYRFRSGASLDATWTNRFNVPANPGWQGSDSTYSVPIASVTRKLGSAATTTGWSMFTAGDTFVGWADNSSPRRRSRDASGNLYALFPANTISLFNGTSSSGSQYFRWKGLPFTDPNFLLQDKNAVAMVPNGEASSARHVRWPLDGTVVNHGFGGTWLVQFWYFVETRTEDDKPSLEVQRVDLATWITGAVHQDSNYPYRGAAGGSWNISSPPNLWLAKSGPYTSHRVMGNAVLNLATVFDAFTPDQFVYVYGIQEAGSPAKKQVFVARANPTELADPRTWRYWTGGGFPSQPNAIGAAQPLRDTSGNVLEELASEFSVIELPNGHYAMIYMQNDGLTSAGLPSSSVKVVARTTTEATGRSPAGPWSAPVTLLTLNLADTGNTSLGLPNLNTSGFPDDVYWAYGAKAHAQFAKRETATADGELLISVNFNSFGNQYAAFHLTDIYRPRFFRATFYKVTGQNQ